MKRVKKNVLSILKTNSKLISTNKKLANTRNIKELVFNILHFKSLFQEDKSD